MSNHSCRCFTFGCFCTFSERWSTLVEYFQLGWIHHPWFSLPTSVVSGATGASLREFAALVKVWQRGSLRHRKRDRELAPCGGLVIWKGSSWRVPGFVFQLYDASNVTDFVSLKNPWRLTWSIIPWRFGSDHFPFFLWVICKLHVHLLGCIHFRVFQKTACVVCDPCFGIQNIMDSQEANGLFVWKGFIWDLLLEFQAAKKNKIWIYIFLNKISITDIYLNTISASSNNGCIIALDIILCIHETPFLRWSEPGQASKPVRHWKYVTDKSHLHWPHSLSKKLCFECKTNTNLTRWWFQPFFIFTPMWGKIPILTNVFQMGWNHQPLKYSTVDTVDVFPS